MHPHQSHWRWVWLNLSLNYNSHSVGVTSLDLHWKKTSLCAWISMQSCFGWSAAFDMHHFCSLLLSYVKSYPHIFFLYSKCLKKKKKKITVPSLHFTQNRGGGEHWEYWERADYGLPQCSKRKHTTFPGYSIYHMQLCLCLIPTLTILMFNLFMSPRCH